MPTIKATIKQYKIIAKVKNFSTGSGSASYTHEQASALATWTITHNLGKHPHVTTIDTANSLVFGSVQYDSLNQVTISFSVPVSGKAYLN
jgi:hypothetical protein